LEQAGQALEEGDLFYEGNPLSGALIYLATVAAVRAAA
jgi:hypothetical protein